MTLAALLFAAALGAALMAVWLWSAWHPDRARCALCRVRSRTGWACTGRSDCPCPGRHAYAPTDPRTAVSR
jgi:hypothetical protein